MLRRRERGKEGKKKKVVFLNSQMEKRQGEGWEEMDSFFFLVFYVFVFFFSRLWNGVRDDLFFFFDWE